MTHAIWEMLSGRRGAHESDQKNRCSTRIAESAVARGAHESDQKKRCSTRIAESAVARGCTTYVTEVCTLAGQFSVHWPTGASPVRWLIEALGSRRRSESHDTR